jgi:succinoglycan biosynthesis transport protein ExoP
MTANMFPRAKKGMFPSEHWEVWKEQFRGLRTIIDFAFKGRKNKVILVSSAVPGEGKTQVAVHLARVLALASWKTLLLDGDMRRPDIHTRLGIEQGPGLSDILSKKSLVEGAGRRTDIECCDVLPAGSSPDSPSELISANMAGLLRGLSGLYDYIVIDTPPLLPVTDTLLMSKYADGILMVVRSQETPREVVKEALDQLGSATVLGFVMNGMSLTERYHSYYGY